MKELIGDPYVCFGIVIFCMIGFLCILWGVNNKEKRRIKRDVQNRTIWQIRMLNERKHMSTLL